MQICPNGRGVIYITLKRELKIGKYCKYDVIDVTISGGRAVLVKPAGKREAVVTLKGIQPNTRDDAFLDFLKQFGHVVTNKVIHGVFTEGPIKGMRNCDRNFKMEIKPNTSLGSYHVLDGQRVSLKYPGHQQTCARCPEPALTCKGRGIAKKCESEGGLKADFNNYILELWEKVGYSPEGEGTKNLDGTALEENASQEGGDFTPQKVSSDTDKFTEAVIKNIPEDTDHGEIVEFLVLSGLPERKKDEIISHNQKTDWLHTLEETLWKHTLL